MHEQALGNTLYDTWCGSQCCTESYTHTHIIYIYMESYLFKVFLLFLFGYVFCFWLLTSRLLGFPCWFVFFWLLGPGFWASYCHILTSGLPGSPPWLSSFLAFLDSWLLGFAIHVWMSCVSHIKFYEALFGLFMQYVTISIYLYIYMCVCVHIYVHTNIPTYINTYISRMRGRF